MVDAPTSGEVIEPVLVHDDGQLLYVNDAAVSLFGRAARDTLLGSSLLEHVAEQYRPPLTEQFERVRGGDTPAIGLQIELDLGANRRRNVIALTSLVEWDGSEQLETVLFAIDTPLPAQLSGPTLAESPVGISIADATRDDEPLIYVNDEFRTLTGYERAEVLGRNCRFLQGPRTSEATVAELRAATDAAKPITVELRNYRKDGTLFWNRLTVTPIEDDDGTVTHFLGYQEDVTDRKLFERQTALFKQQADAAEQSIFITDADGIIEYVNPAFERTTGYTADEVIGESPRLLKSGEQGAAFYQELWETITAGDIWEAEITNQRKNGGRYRTTQKIIPVTDADGVITHFISIEEEVTDERFTGQVLDVMDRVLRHNVRNSMQAIGGFAELLERDLDDHDTLDEAEYRTAVQTIRTHAAELAELSDRTRMIRELIRRRNTQQPLPADAIPGFIDDRRDEHPDAVIELTMDVPADVVIQNGSLLELALDEAIDNAIRHSDRAHPHVTVSVSEAGAGTDGELRIEIVDDGPGIPDSQWDVIKSGEETPLKHGSGIGFWLIYWTITGLGGTVDRVAAEPRGTRLVFHVPIGDSADGD